MKTSIFKIMKLLLALILFNSCEKVCEETAWLYSSFIIGHDNVCMDITTFGSVMNPKPRSNAHIELDIDNDNVIDFKIQSVYDHLGISGDEIKRSSIVTVNTSFEISVIEMPDTSRICMDTTYNNYYYSGMHYNTYSNYSCSGKDRKDTIISTSIYPYPIVYSIGDAITQRESWLNGGFSLAMSHTKAMGTPYSIIQGTWLGSQDNKYILFRKESNGAYLYGWLKLSISSFTNVRLHEYAIQKR